MDTGLNSVYERREGDMYKIIREVLFFFLSLLSLILFVQSLPLHEDRPPDTALDKELKLQKENHLEGRRKLNKEEGAADNGLVRVNETALDEEGSVADAKSNTGPKTDENKSRIQGAELILKAEDGTLIDINKATAEELTGLKGIGPKLAERIVVYRNENGVFMSLDTLLNVKGIGSKKLNQLKNQQ